ncbi:hypothetical protein CIHG_08991 [Coccidioides immitis H538.4]|uniref:Uncharacterized protein n=2 Tax=Coccidioides immitis TaxID=5501 RepID=A0A0J8S2J8_COCIT|nr:hypothetical protein CIRG_04080 [Coccidioides immitis RMSCC 2394]KMU91056.1 hypothetical protein CIHG_08991 [Coccidioides immitis H538.4]
MSKSGASVRWEATLVARGVHATVLPHSSVSITIRAVRSHKNDAIVDRNERHQQSLMVRRESESAATSLLISPPHHTTQLARVDEGGATSAIAIGLCHCAIPANMQNIAYPKICRRKE